MVAAIFKVKKLQEKLNVIKKLIVASKESRTIALDFEILDTAGEGSFSKVYRVRNRLDGALYAVKKNKKPMMNNSAQLDSLREVYSLAALQSHPNIVRYYGAWLEGSRGGEYLCIQTEFFDQGTLAESHVEQGKAMAEDKLILVCRDIGRALQYMHSRGLVHLDVKPDNIFHGVRGFEAVFVLGDFGLTCRADGSEGLKDGDSRYIAREALRYVQNGTEEMAFHLESRDIFSLGATLYELAVGTPNAGSGDAWNRLRNNAQDIEHTLRLRGLSKDAAGLITLCLHKEASKRPSAKKLVKRTEEIMANNVEELRRQLEMCRRRIRSLEAA